MDAILEMLTHARALGALVKRVDEDLHVNADALSAYALREYAYRALLARWLDTMDWMRSNDARIPDMDSLYEMTRAALGREAVSEDSKSEIGAEIDGKMNNDS